MKNNSFCSWLILLLITCLSGLNLFAQVNNKYDASEGFVVHEWGTFTTLSQSNGSLLSGLELEEEHLPSFVQDLCFCPTLRTIIPPLWKGLPAAIGNPTSVTSALKNVSLKMETPVLYFYSSEPSKKQFTLNVEFNGGSISQWYPARTAGEYYAGNFYIGPYVPGYSTYPNSNQFYEMNFSKPRKGWIQWKGAVLPLNTSLRCTSDPALETPIWVSPRATESNLVKTEDPGGQVEKFLFYRGIGNFNPPFKVEFNTSHNLVITNVGKDPLDYVMVFEKKKDGNTQIWWSGSVSGETKKVIVKLLFKKTINLEKELDNFAQHLVSAGLYEDEAVAMLNTWKKSYFDHEGLKVFWIVPPAVTDLILPIQISPAPKALKRVLVGRSEILTPEFEKLLAEESAIVNEKYKDDRFLLAYRAALAFPPLRLTDYNVIEETNGVTRNEYTNLEIFPNPTSGKFTLKIYQAANIKIYSMAGELLNSVGRTEAGITIVDLNMFPNGLYLITAEFAGGIRKSQKIIKN